MTIGYQQWMREIQVIIGSGGSGISIENLRIHFEVTKSIEPTPNPGTIKIYNLNPTHEQQIRNEFTDIILNAGYKGNTKLIFRGTIRHVFSYPEPPDRITEIECGDGDLDYRKAYMNITLKSGSTDADLIAAALGSFSKVTSGVTQVSKQPYIRGRSFSGSTRDILHFCAKDNNADWSIQDERLYLIPVNNVLPGQAIVVNSETGMLSTPTINSSKGIEVKCLLNPQIAIHGVIWLNNSDIKLRVRRQKLFTHVGSKLMPQQPNVALDPDGLYKVFKVIHRGDNRGKEFVSDIACVGINAPIPQQIGGTY
jgi:hypothetical protein